MRWKTPLEKSKTKTYICKICFKEIENDSIHSLIYKTPCLCNDCFDKSHPILKSFLFHGVKALAIYEYDDFLKSYLYQFKGCYDIELKDIFLEYYKPYLKMKYAGYVLVPAPSFIDADKERGFNHVVEIFNPLGLEIVRCIEKTSNIKQSSLSAIDRQNVRNHLSFVGNADLTNKKVLIVDDVLTTGSTVKAILELIKMRKPKSIQILVMSMVVDKKSTNDK